MSVWRRKALALFPSLKDELTGDSYTTYSLFMDLRRMVREAHHDNDEEMLRNIYCFAQWCLRQKSEDMWNAAGVSFYEHLFDDYRSGWHLIVPWLSPTVISDVSSLWELFHSEEELKQIHKLINERKSTRYQECY